jgi:hypothetical protein
MAAAVSMSAGASSAEEAGPSGYFLRLALRFAGFQRMSQFVEEIGMPDRSYSPSPDEVVYGWENAFPEENGPQVSISATESRSRVTDKSVSAFFSDPGEEGHDYERAGKFFVELCRDYERTQKHVSKVSRGGGYGWLSMRAMYPLNADFFLSVTLYEDDEGTAETIFKVITSREAGSRIIRCTSDLADQNSRLYSKPDTASAVMEELELGSEFYVLDTRSVKGMEHPWYEVSSTGSASGRGWVYGEHMAPPEEITLDQAETDLRESYE